MRERMLSAKVISFIIVVLLILVSIIYLAVIFEFYKKKEYIFSPYIPSTPPASSFHPLGSVTPLTPQQIEDRNAIINNHLRSAQ